MMLMPHNRFFFSVSVHRDLHVVEQKSYHESDGKNMDSKSSNLLIFSERAKDTVDEYSDLDCKADIF
jgi:hypothetical protein